MPFTRNERWIATICLLPSLIVAAPLPSETITVPVTSSPTLFPALRSMSSVPTASSTFEAVSPIFTSPPVVQEQVSPLLLEPGRDTVTIGPTPTAASWTAPPNFSNLAAFSVSAYAAGASNLAVLAGSPSASGDAAAEALKGGEVWDQSQNSLQVFYPQGSINPGNKPQGGAEFYAQPVDMTAATNATLQYSVYFPPDFDFVKGGKMPGLYGGHKGCSGGNAAEDCFSTRLMWRSGGLGELYLYAPKDKQTPSLCQTKPKSICDSQYGLSIGRGAWTFARGNWTTVRQDVWLNTPGQNDGGFNIWVDGQLVLTANDVRYRENADACLQGQNMPTVDALSFGNSSMDTMDEDWQTAESLAATLTSTTFVTVTSTMSSTATGLRRRQEATDNDAQLTNRVTAQATDSATLASGPVTRPITMPATTLQTLTLASMETAVTPLPTAASYPVSVAYLPNSAPAINAAPLIVESPPVVVESGHASPQSLPACSVGFMGMFFSTFFGGHTSDWASPKDQYSYFRDFEMWINI